MTANVPAIILGIKFLLTVRLEMVSWWIANYLFHHLLTDAEIWT